MRGEREKDGKYPTNLSEARKTRTLVFYYFREYNTFSSYFLEHGVFSSPEVTFASWGPCHDFRLNNVDIFREYTEYDRFIFLDDNVAGPFVPLWYEGTWVDIFTGLIGECKLGSPVIKDGCCRDLLVTDRIGLEIGMSEQVLSFNLGELAEKFSRAITRKGHCIISLSPEKKVYHPYEVVFSPGTPKQYFKWHSRSLKMRNSPRPLEGNTLVLYTFHEYNDNVEHFIRNGFVKKDNIDFLFIVNDPSFGRSLPGETLVRENIGKDFGAWKDGVLHNGNLNKYDKFVFLNCSVRGPFLPPYVEKSWVEV